MEDYILLLGLIVALFTIVSFGIILNQKIKLDTAVLDQDTGELTTRAAQRARLAKSVKLVQWRAEYNIDDGVIDEDHRTLFNLINRFCLNIPNFTSLRQAMPFMISLTEYTHKHFAREEELQEMSGYAFYEEHVQKHALLLRELHIMTEKLRHSTPETLTDTVVEIGDFLQDWLISHVLQEDLTMKPYVERMSEQSSKMESLRKQPRRSMHP